MISRLSLRWTVPAVALAAIAVGLSPEAVASWLLETPDRAQSIVLGVWFFKALLLVHAAMLLWLGEMHPGSKQQEGRLLERRGGSDHAPSRGELSVVAALVSIGVGLRLFDLGDGLWYDEITTLVGQARLPVMQIISTFESQNQHMIYSLLARVSFVAFGESAWALRLPAALFGVASLWAVYWFGIHVTERREALLAATLLTFSYHHVWFSQNARGYTGLLLWTLLSSGLFLRMLQNRSPDKLGVALAYAVAIGLGAYTHITAVFVAVGHAVIWAVLAWKARADVRGMARWRPLIALGIGATLSLQLYALVLPQFVETLLAPTMPGTELAWKNPAWFVAETVRGLAVGVPGGMVAVAVGVAIFTTGWASYARQSVPIWSAMILPAILLVGAILILRHNFWPRLFFFSVGFAALFVIRGVSAISTVIWKERGRALATAASVVLVLLSATTVQGAWNPKQDFWGAREHIERARDPSDAVVTVDLANFPYQDYMQLDWLPVSSVGELMAIERNHRRTWVLYTFPTHLAGIHSEIWNRLQQEYSAAAEYPGTVGGGAIIIMVRG